MSSDHTVASASWVDIWADTTTRLRRTMKPWAPRDRKPWLSTSRTPSRTVMATALFQSTPPSLMTVCSAERGLTQRRDTNTTTASLSLARPIAPTSPRAACCPVTVSPLRSPAKPSRALSAAGRGIPTACHPTWARKIVPAALGTAATPGSCRCLADTAPAPAPAASSSRSPCDPTHRRPTSITILCLHTRARLRELPAVLSALQTPTTGGLWSTTPGLSTTQHTALAVSLVISLLTLTQVLSGSLLENLQCVVIDYILLL